ncbi:hypothetical protein H8356DRAFT_1728956 [Neocallimastix lanati (nom. inval.)]|nr:hypothetical protein H8356DRAFT_1728956 [Neocallimastix sp. JGI-2020a]
MNGDVGITTLSRSLPEVLLKTIHRFTLIIVVINIFVGRVNFTISFNTTIQKNTIWLILNIIYFCSIVTGFSNYVITCIINLAGKILIHMIKMIRK